MLYNGCYRYKAVESVGGDMAYTRKKNRYYKGKQLQSEDFKLEQQYLESLTYQSNRYAIGAGILQGLRLSMVNDKQISISPGCAIDGEGRMLVVEQEVIRSLHELTGFDTIKQGCAPIVIQAKEQLVDEVFCAVSEEPQHKEYDHIHCDWEVAIVPMKRHKEPFFERTILYEDRDLIITQIIPSLLPAINPFCIQVEVYEKKPVSSFSFSYTLSANDFEQPQMLIAKEVKEQHETRNHQFTFPVKRNATFGNVKSTLSIITDLTLEKAGMMIKHPITYQQEFPISEHLTEDLQEYLYTNELEQRDPSVYIGCVYIEEKRRSWKQASIEQADLMTYLPSREVMRRQAAILSSMHYDENRNYQDTSSAASPEQIISKYGCISIQELQCIHNVYYSKELSHGFGANEVMIELSLQTQNQSEWGKKQVLIQGDGSLFLPKRKQEGYQLASQVFLEDGTFQIALKISSQIHDNVTIIWKATLVEREKPKLYHMELIRLEPSIVELKPLETCTFTPVFDEEAHVCECRFSLSKDGDGLIGEDGTYHAPLESGVYQIQAESERGEIVYAYAYVKA